MYARVLEVQWKWRSPHFETIFSMNLMKKNSHLAPLKMSTSLRIRASGRIISVVLKFYHFTKSSTFWKQYLSLLPTESQFINWMMLKLGAIEKRTQTKMIVESIRRFICRSTNLNSSLKTFALSFKFLQENAPMSFDVSSYFRNLLEMRSRYSFQALFKARWTFHLKSNTTLVC